MEQRHYINPTTWLRREVRRDRMTGHYTARVASYKRGMRLWSQSTGICRLTRSDAENDATALVHDILSATSA
jgi:hypothetical protein